MIAASSRSALVHDGPGRSLAYATDAFDDLELDTVDLRFSIRGDEQAAARTW